jgi:hypothetical protein
MTRPSASVTLGQTKSPAVVGRGEVSPGKGRRLDRRGQARRLSAAGAPGGRCCPPLYPARIRLDRPLDAFSGAGFLAAGPARLRRLPADPRAFCAGGGTRLALRHRQSSILNTVWIVHSKFSRQHEKSNTCRYKPHARSSLDPIGFLRHLLTLSVLAPKRIRRSLCRRFAVDRSPAPRWPAKPRQHVRRQIRFRLCLEDRWLLCERIDALARLRDGFLITMNLARPGTVNAPFFLSSFWPIEAAASMSLSSMCLAMSSIAAGQYERAACLRS